MIVDQVLKGSASKLTVDTPTTSAGSIQYPKPHGRTGQQLCSALSSHASLRWDWGLGGWGVVTRNYLGFFHIVKREDHCHFSICTQYIYAILVKGMLKGLFQLDNPVFD